MNKYSKIGLSALCGSLASILAANAGTLDVTGNAEATWTSLGGQETGNPIGMKTNLSFTGSGELDGGQTFSVLVANGDKNAYSSANIALNTNSTGTFKLSSAEGGQGIGGYDDNMPRAWEEVWDTAIATKANFQKGVGSTTNLSWTSPKMGGTTIQIAYAPDNDGSSSTDKNVSGAASDRFGAGWDLVIDSGTKNGGINLFLGASRTEVAKVKTEQDLSSDHEEAVVGLQFKLGPVALGGQVSAERIPTQTVNSTNFYANSSWGIAFNVNDDLSVSYSETRHVQGKTKKQSWSKDVAASGGLNAAAGGRIDTEHNPKSWMNGESIQVAYTIAGVGLKYAHTEYDNTAYGFDKKAPKESQVVAVSLAF